MKLLTALLFSAVGSMAEAGDDIIKITLSQSDLASLSSLIQRSETTNSSNTTGLGVAGKKDGRKSCEVIDGVCYVPEPRFPQIEFSLDDDQSTQQGGVALATPPGQSATPPGQSSVQQQAAVDANKTDVSKVVGEVLSQTEPRVWKNIRAYPKFVVKHFAKEAAAFAGLPFRFVVELEISRYDYNKTKGMDSNSPPVMTTQSVLFFGDYRYENENTPSLAINSYYTIVEGADSNDSNDRVVVLGNPNFFPSKEQFKLAETLSRKRAVEKVLAVSGNYIPNIFEMQTAVSSNDWR